MRKFVLNLSGYESDALSKREIREMFASGVIDGRTPCCPTNATTWGYLSDFFPDLLDAAEPVVRLEPGAGPMRRSIAKWSVTPSPDELLKLLGSCP